jgi:hypothetical protein
MENRWVYIHNHIYISAYISFISVDNASSYSNTEFTEFTRKQRTVISDFIKGNKFKKIFSRNVGGRKVKIQAQKNSNS